MEFLDRLRRGFPLKNSMDEDVWGLIAKFFGYMPESNEHLADMLSLLIKRNIELARDADNVRREKASLRERVYDFHQELFYNPRGRRYIKRMDHYR